MRYTLTIDEDQGGRHYAQLHNPIGELHFISRSFDDPENARQAARDWAGRYKVEIEGEQLGSEYLANRDPGDEDKASG